MKNLNINNTFTKELPADSILENSRRQVENACFSYVIPKQTANPEMLHVSPEMVKNLGISNEEASSELFLKVFLGAFLNQFLTT